MCQGMTGNPENPESPRIAFYCIYISPTGRSRAKGGAATGLGDVLLPAAQNSASENGEHIFIVNPNSPSITQLISDTRKKCFKLGHPGAQEAISIISAVTVLSFGGLELKELAYFEDRSWEESDSWW